MEQCWCRTGGQFLDKQNNMLNKFIQQMKEEEEEKNKTFDFREKLRI